MRRTTFSPDGARLERGSTCDRLRSHIVLGSITLLAIACSGSSGTGPAQSGALAVSIAAPGGVTAPVFVSGPNGFLQSLSGTQTLTGLTAGSYVVSASAGASSDPIVGDLFPATITGSPASVTAGATANASVTFASTGTAGHLWVANQLGNAIGGYTAAQLSTSGSPAPAIAIGSASHPGSNASSLAFDASGGMWEGDGSDTLFYFSAAQIATSTTASPTRRLIGAGGSVTSITGIAFDAQGNLWATDQANRVVEYSAAQLAAGGVVTPNITLTSAFGSIARPWDLAFDAHGNLWVCNYGNNSVASFTPAQIASSGSPQPSAGLTGTKGLSGPLSIAFDRNGNLWVASIIDSLSEFSASNLTTVGSPAPAVVITGSLHTPIGLAFDGSDALWVASYQGNHVLRFLSSQLASTGAPTPSVSIGGSTVGLPAKLAFAPHASSLPLH